MRDVISIFRSARPTARMILVVFALAPAAWIGCGGSPEARIAEARALQDAGDFSNSIETLREVLATAPDHEEANYLLGVALVQTRQPSLAIWPLRKATESETYGTTANLLLASTLLQTEGYEEALAVTDELLESNPDHLTALIMRVTANIALGRDEEALVDSEHMLELDPEHFQAQVSRATALQRLDRREEAETAWLRLRETSRDAGDPATALRGCAALVSFYQTVGSKKAEPTLRECVEEHPTDPTMLRIASEFFDGKEKSEEATALWESAVEDEPDSFELRQGLAQRYLAAGQEGEAEALLSETAELFDDARAWDRLAGFYQDRGEFEKAREAVERALERHAGRSEMLLFRKADLLVTAGEIDQAEAIAEEFEQPAYRDLVIARVRQARGDAAGALEAAEAGLARWPNNAPARYLAGTLAQELGMLEKALSHYREATRKSPGGTDAALSAAAIQLSRGEYEEAGALAKRHTANRPISGPEAHLVAVRAAMALGRYDDARITLDDLAKLDEHQVVVVAERAALERRAEGPAAAAKVVEQSGLDLAKPDHHRLLRSLVEDRVALERYDAALEAVADAVERGGETADLLDLRGRVYAAMGREEDARAAFERALALDAGHAGAHQALAHLELEAGDARSAIEHAEAAADASDEAEYAYFAGQVLLSQGRADAAQERFAQALERDPGHARAANDLAWLLAERGQDLDRALELAQRAARREARPEFWDTLGWVQLQRDDPGAAVASFEKALAADPESSSVRYRLGLALESLGREEEARVALREALGSGSFPEAEAARARLAKLESNGQARP